MGFSTVWYDVFDLYLHTYFSKSQLLFAFSAKVSKTFARVAWAKVDLQARRTVAKATQIVLTELVVHQMMYIGHLGLIWRQPGAAKSRRRCRNVSQ